MKQVKDFTSIQFTYESKEERDSHVSELESYGWKCVSASVELFAELYMDNLIRG